MKSIIILLCVTFIIATSQNKVEDYDHDLIDHMATDMSNFLRTKTTDELRSYCIIVDSWARQLKGEKPTGLIYEYFMRIEKDFLMPYIMSMGYLHNELFDIEYFKQIIANIQEGEDESNLFLALEENENENINSESESVRMLTKMGGLHDFIFFQPRETLEKWALTCEAHHRSVNELQIIGGIEDYITTLSHQELVEYILKEADEHFELNSAKGLDSYAKAYGIEH